MRHFGRAEDRRRRGGLRGWGHGRDGRGGLVAAATLLVAFVIGLGSAARAQEAPPRTLKVEVDRPLYYFDETLRGEIGGLLPAERIRIEHLDAFGRVIERIDTRKGRAATQPFRFRLNHPFTVLHRIVVTGEKGARGEARFLLAPRVNTWDRYQVIWTGRMKADQAQALAALRAAGVTAAVARTPEEVEAGLSQDFRLLLGFGAHQAEPPAGPMFLPADAERVAQAYAGTKDPSSLLRAPDLDDPQAQEAWTAALLETVRTYRPYAPLGYSLGGRLWVTDPARPLDVCFSPQSLEAFRGWLRRQYGSLAELNAEWEVKFGGWSQVVPMPAADLVARERARAAGGRLALGPWLMHRRFLDERFAEVVTGLSGAAVRREEAARVGFGGFAGANAYGGYDASRLPGAVGWMAVREGPASAALVHGFNAKGRPLRRLPAAVVTEVPLKKGAGWRLWDSLLRGDRGALLVGAPRGADPSALKEALAEVLPVMAEIRSGLGAVFARAGGGPRSDPVALVYSQPSIDVSWMLDALALGEEWSQAADTENSTWQRNFVAWLELLQDVGIHPAIITPEEVGTPAFRDARYRAVILPKTIALADAEGEALRRYVREGGFLIADSQCGLFDERGRERLKPLLDDLFGIRRAGRRSAEARGRFTPLVTAEAEEQPAPDPLAVLGLRLDPSGFRPVEPGLRRGAAPALVTFGETAALLARPPAPRSPVRGNSLYLNVSLLGYPQARAAGGGEPLRQLLGNVLEVVELEPEVRVLRADTGRDLPLVAKRLFQQGGLRYLALLYPWGSRVPENPSEQKVEVRLRERPYFYDIRAGEFRARTEVFRTTLVPYQPRIYALLPYKVEEVLIEGRASARDLTYDITILARAQRTPTEDHVVRLALDGPDGRNRPTYTAVLVVPKGHLTAQTRIGLEEPAGRWTIRVTDVLTGVQAEAQFNLEEVR